METMTPSAEQIDKAVDVIEAAAKKGGKEAISELVKNGVLNVGNFQRGVLAQGDKIAAVVKIAVKTIIAELAEKVVGRLKRLFAERTIELAETDGKETLAGASDVFKAGIYGAAKRGVACKATPKTLLAAYEMIKDGSFQQIFGGFGENLKRLWWTEAQIVAFCRDHRDLLRTGGYGTFFLFEGDNGGFFVAYVHVRVDGRLSVDVRPLSDDYVWRAKFTPRFVVPQL
jgi:hypothetical protein